MIKKTIAFITTAALAVAQAEKVQEQPKLLITDLCASITNYWPFDDQGELAAWNGQADSDPFHTAVMHPITGPHQAGDWVAGPVELLGRTVILQGLGELPVLDTFGAEAYRNGAVYHGAYGQHVIGLDVFTPEPLHYLDCNWWVSE